MSSIGPIGRLGRWTAQHPRTVFVTWALIALALGVFAPRAEHALTGAGWEATGSESVDVRKVVDREFGGQSSYSLTVVVKPPDRNALAEVRAKLETHKDIAAVAAPQRSPDGTVAIVSAGAAADPNDMVRVADDLKDELAAVGGRGVDVDVTGAPGMWSDFNTANKEAMMKSELISWPVTLAILVLAFGSLVAAGLPLMLTILGLMAAAGSLFLGAQLFDISIWAMNFALMFALALGIDYALFVVHRFRGALFADRRDPVNAVALTMDTAGKAVLFSGLTVLVSLSAVMLVPSPAFRSMSLGIMLSVVFVLGATLTLLPAVLAKLGPRVDKLGLRWVRSGEHRSPRFAAWGERLWRRPLAYGAVALALLVALALPVMKLETGMPSIKVVPSGDSSRDGYETIQAAFGPGAPGTLQVTASITDSDQAARGLAADPGVARVLPAQTGAGSNVLFPAVPAVDPSDERLGDTIERLRDDLPASAAVGGAAAENYDLEEALGATTLPVIAIVLALGFLLLLFALQAPVIAAVGVVTNLLATGAAFGVAKLIFQDGNLAGVLGFESQGFMNAWAPVFFFAMVFAISMDYTVFLLSSAKEHWDREREPKAAMVGGLAHSGRVIFAAAGVMAAVFFTFALSGPLPPKEMGVVLGVATVLDAILVRLLLVPVLLRLLGRTAWWLPKALDRILPDVRFGHT
jgi:RND superfamily putative drug exporter